MSKFLSKRTGKPAIALIILAITLSLGIYLETRPRVAPGHASLTDIQNIDTLRTQFNRDAGNARLVILVSPT